MYKQYQCSRRFFFQRLFCLYFSFFFFLLLFSKDKKKEICALHVKRFVFKTDVIYDTFIYKKKVL